jgi:hypothetical protein
MNDNVRELAGMRVLICDDPPLLKESDANTFISAAWQHEAAMVAIPIQRLSEDFFRLSTRLAGEVIQKFANYRLRLAIVGDISDWVSQSKSLRDFVYEANNGQVVWFVADLDELSRRLAIEAGQDVASVIAKP